MLFKGIKAVNRSLLVQHLTKQGKAMLRTLARGVRVPRYKLNMRQFILATMLCIFVITANADQISASQTVIEAIHSAQNDNFNRFRNIVDMDKVSKHKRHAYSENELIKLFKTIKINEVTFKDKSSVKVLHMLKPLNLQFKIQSINRTNVFPRVVYKIIAVHP